MADNLKLSDLQSYDELFSPLADASASGSAGAQEPGKQNEQRRTNRRAASAEVRVGAAGLVTMDRMLDISEGGMSLQSNRQYAVGTTVDITIDPGIPEMPVAGSLRARVVYCFYLGESAYRAGFAFVTPSAPANNTGAPVDTAG